MLNKFEFLALSAAFLIIIAIVLQVNENLNPEMNRIQIDLLDSVDESGSINVAFMTDLHIGESDEAYTKFEEIWSDVLAVQPDIILLGGDYTKSGYSIADPFVHRKRIASTLGESQGIPVIAVLGNHETLSSPLIWSMDLRDRGLRVLNNEVSEVKSLDLCVRGLGDYFTSQFRYTDFPAECENKRKVTLTHDPGGAFHPEMHGLILSGHTHCGQIRLPVLGAIFMPTSAPEGARCGLYRDEKITLFVSAGVGTSMLPVRFRAQAQWDLLSLVWERETPQ